jgi:hypothetical protein
MKVCLEWIMDLNVKTETMKLLEENFCDFELGKEFLGIITT